MKVALLSIEDLTGYVADDDLVVEPLMELGCAAESVPWRRDAVEWRGYAGVIIRTTWDYQNDLETFLRVLRQVEAQTRLANPLATVRWNADKKIYLRDLAGRGASVVPTVWYEGKIEGRQVEEWFSQLRADELVIKPTVGANAQDTVRFRRGEEALATLSELFDDRSCMVQPFMNGIVEEGEFSLFYFNGRYSHAILKTPRPADFRVQEEHGGTIRAVTPPPTLSAAGEKIMRLVPSTPLYARVDLVRTGEDEFALMELELIEPSLYLRKAEHAPRLFAEAIKGWLSQNHP